SSTPPMVKASGRSASLHDAWMRALRAPDGRIEGDPRELAALAEQVSQWRRPLDVVVSAPFRLCFRLEEPRDEDGSGDWHVSYLLQAVDDLSLLVPAGVAWKGKGRGAKVLGRDGFKPREYLLSALGQAAVLCPRIEASLKSAAPDGYELDAA